MCIRIALTRLFLQLQGDSGGPLVVNGQLVGVASWVDQPCGKGTPDVYTKVFSYRSFIESAMNSPPDQIPQDLPQDLPGLPHDFPQFGQPSLPSDGYDLDMLLHQQYPTLQQWYPQIVPGFHYPGLYLDLEGWCIYEIILLHFYIGFVLFAYMLITMCRISNLFIKDPVYSMNVYEIKTIL